MNEAIAPDLANAPVATAQTEGTTPAIITLFSKNDCGRCTTTAGQFKKAEVPFRYINVETDTEPRAEFADADGNPRTALDYVTQEFGTAMPAVELRDAEDRTVRLMSWSNMNPMRITEVKKAYGKPAS